MKISFKIFIITYCILMALTAATGFLIVNNLYHSELDQRIEDTEQSMTMLTMYVTVIDDIPDQTFRTYSLIGFESQMKVTDKGGISPYVGDEEGWKSKVRLENVSALDDGQTVSGVIKIEEGTYVQVTRRVRDLYLIVYGSLKDVFDKRDTNYNIYRHLILITSVVVAIILFLVTSYITRPIKKITRAAELISAGDYSVRVDDSYKSMRSLEVQALGKTFNQLTNSTEEHIAALENEARKQEDFVGNFTHEIKTPLTSIIGYADLLRSGNISEDKQYEYSSFIYREGKRLEQMSFHLLDLIVMGKTDFELSRVSVGQVFKQLQSEVSFLQEKYNMEIVTSFEKAYVKAEPTLLIAMLLNLVDNACKASKEGDRIIVVGAKETDRYLIQISDKGRGIPADQLDKILEPFYMVDKSRARKQGGAGLGLALCNRIAGIHNSKLTIQSVEGEGTDIFFALPYAEENDVEDIEKADGVQNETLKEEHDEK